MTYSTVDEAEKALDAVVDRIRRTEAHRERLYDERRQLFAWLLEHGVRQASIARRAGVTGYAVTLAVRKGAPAAAEG